MVAYRDPASEFNDAFAEAAALFVGGKTDEALAALNALPASEQTRVGVLALRCEILMSQGHWAPAATISEALAKADPRNPGHWVHWAYASRRHDSLAAAEKILREAIELHPAIAVIPFNLACYCAQSERFDESLIFLRRAIKLDEAFARLAQTDADLAPLRARLPADHWLWKTS